MISPRITRITSAQNETFKELLRRAEGDSSGSFFCHGLKQTLHILSRHPDRLRSLLIRDSESLNAQVVELLERRWQQVVSRFSLEASLFQALDPLAGADLIGVFEIPEPSSFAPGIELSETTVVLGLSDPSNVGAAIRTMVAFGVSHCILSKESANPYHPRSVRASAGTVLDVRFSRAGTLEEICQSLPMESLALDLNGTDLRRIAWPKKYCLILGHESHGIPRSFHGTRVSIPIEPVVESLNASVALGIALNWAQWRSESPI